MNPRIPYHAALLVLGSCNSSSTAGTNTQGDTVVVSGTAYLETTTSQNPAGGATIEAVGGIATTTADANGKWSLTLPVNTNILLRATAPGAIGVEIIYQAPPGGATGQDFLTLSSPGVLSGQAGTLATTIDTTSKGLVIAELEGVSATNYQVAIGAPNGGSFGIDDQGKPVAGSATQSVSNADVIFYNVTSGTTTVTVTPPAGKTCSVDYAAPTYPVDVGLGTQIAFTCN